MPLDGGHWAIAVQRAEGSVCAGMLSVPLRALQWGADEAGPAQKTKARQSPLKWQVPSSSAGGLLHLRSTCAQPQGGPLALRAPSLQGWGPHSLATLLRSPPGGSISYSNWLVPYCHVKLGHATLQASHFPDAWHVQMCSRKGNCGSQCFLPPGCTPSCHPFPQ